MATLSASIPAAAGGGPWSSFNPGSVTTLQSQVSSLQMQVGDLRTEAPRHRGDRRVATAMTPSAPGKTTVTVNASAFSTGEYGAGLAFAHRLNLSTPVILHGAYGNGGGNQHVGRVGFRVRVLGSHAESGVPRVRGGEGRSEVAYARKAQSLAFVAVAATPALKSHAKSRAHGFPQVELALAAAAEGRYGSVNQR